MITRLRAITKKEGLEISPVLLFLSYTSVSTPQARHDFLITNNLHPIYSVCKSHKHSTITIFTQGTYTLYEQYFPHTDETSRCHREDSSTSKQRAAEVEWQTIHGMIAGYALCSGSLKIGGRVIEEQTVGAVRAYHGQHVTIHLWTWLGKMYLMGEKDMVEEAVDRMSR